MQQSVRDYGSIHRPGVNLLEPQGAEFESQLARELVHCGVFRKERAVIKALNGIRGTRVGGTRTSISTSTLQLVTCICTMYVLRLTE